MSKEKIDVLVNVEEKYRRWCDDYSRDGELVRKGCGQELKGIRSEKTGRTTMCEPVQLPCLDRDGNTVWVYVPHWVTCPEQKEYFLSFMRTKAQENADWKAKNSQDDRQSRGADSSRRRGSVERAF